MVKRILILTDSYYPLINGVVTTYENLKNQLEKSGFQVDFVHPNMFKTFSMPRYNEIRLVWDVWNIKKRIPTDYDAYHIATEGPVGWAARNFLKSQKLPFTTSYCTKFPEYIEKKTGIPSFLTYKIVKWFHNPSYTVMVSTESMNQELKDNGFTNTQLWTRGVDISKFTPIKDTCSNSLKLLYVGRVSVEKNLEDFLSTDVGYAEKIVIGDGPELEEYKEKYPQVNFKGSKTGNALVKEYQEADIFVFPSKTDTFGLVMLEANACGLPVIAFNTTGPKDVIENEKNGLLIQDKSEIVPSILDIIRNYKQYSKNSVDHASQYSWEKVSDSFLNLLSWIEH